MLDLDAMASRQAQQFGQPAETWKSVIWSETFQRLTQNMSDGEVELLISHCPTPSHLQFASEYLEVQSKSMGKSPYQILQDECAQKGIAPGEWVLSMND